jgi:prolyl oligopeptidase
VELRLGQDREPEWVEVVAERDCRIKEWLIVRDYLLVSYIRKTQVEILIFDCTGNFLGEMPVHSDETVHFLAADNETGDLLFESESFTEPVSIGRFTPPSGNRSIWLKRTIPFDAHNWTHEQVCYKSKDGTSIPMFLLGRSDVLASGVHSTIMTAYGGYGISMTPQFSVFVAFLVERGCLFALPNIRGGSEFGAEWHHKAKRRNRQTAFDDFRCAGESLIAAGRTTPDRLAIFGGSNSGLLVGAAMTQCPGLFRAVVCLAPLLDMLRYHLFDNSHVWRDEFGTAEDPDDFAALASYSPYHQIRPGVAYPATLIVSGDADGNCNPLHARKMTARLQAANSSGQPILLDYAHFRGHSPVLPLSDRVEALTDRLAFLMDQLQLRV